MCIQVHTGVYRCMYSGVWYVHVYVQGYTGVCGVYRCLQVYTQLYTEPFPNPENRFIESCVIHLMKQAARTAVTPAKRFSPHPSRSCRPVSVINLE